MDNQGSGSWQNSGDSEEGGGDAWKKMFGNLVGNTGQTAGTDLIGAALGLDTNNKYWKKMNDISMYGSPQNLLGLRKGK